MVCAECENMVCRILYAKNGKLIGHCLRLHTPVNGSDRCPQPTPGESEPKQLELFN